MALFCKTEGTLDKINFSTCQSRSNDRDLITRRQAFVSDIYVTLFLVSGTLAEVGNEFPEAELVFLSRLIPGCRHIK